MPLFDRTYNGKKQWRYRCYYQDYDGKRKQKQSKWYYSRRECAEAEALFLSELSKDDIHVNVTFGTVINDYINMNAKNNKRDTILEKKSIRDKYFQRLLDVRIDKIKPIQLKKLINELDVDLSTSHKNKIYMYLNGTFEHAVNFFGLSKNPMKAIPAFKKTDKERLHQMKIWTPKEFKIFEDAIPDEHREYANYFHLLFWTGLRKNEARSLTFNDFDGRSIHVWRQLDRKKEFVTLKSQGSTRFVALDKETLRRINEQMDKYSSMPGFSSDWFIFGGYEPMSRTAIDYMKKKAIESTSLTPIRIHDFRHSHASYLIEKGVNVYKISKRLGHSSISITLDRYGHLMDREENEILNAIEN